MLASTLSTWIGTLTGRPNRRARRARPAGGRPLTVEALEARTVPTVYTWIPTAAGTYAWSNPANWSSTAPGSVPKQAGDVANITSAAVGNQVINLSEPVAVGALNVGSSGTGTGGFTVVGNGNTLTLQDPSNAPTVTSLAGDGDAILAPVTFLGKLTVTTGSPAPLSFFGPITANGTGILSVTGTGVVAFPESQSLAANVTLAGNGTVTYPTPLFAASYFDSALYAFDAATGATLATLIAPNYNVGPLLSGPAGMTVGPDGNLYLSSQSNDAILQFNLSTYTLNTFVSQAAMTAARLGTLNPNQVFAPAGLRYGPDGDLYVSLNGGQSSTGNGAVIRFDVTDTGGVLSYVPTPTSFAQVIGGLQQPTGLTFGRAANNDATSLYVSYGGLTGSGGVAQVANATTAPVLDLTFIPLGTGGLSTAAGLTWGIGSDNTLYVADLAALEQQFPTVFAGKILQYDAGGGFIKQFNQSSLATKFPADILFDAQGRMLVAELGPTRPPAVTGQIDLLNPNGSYNRLLVSSGQFPNTGTQIGVGTTSGINPSALALLTLPATAVTIDGTLNPGGAGVPGTLTTPSLTFTGTGSTFAITLNGTAPGTGYGNLVSTGTVALNSTNLATNVAAGFTAPLGSQYVIVSAPTILGTFNGLADGALFTSSGQQFQINYIDGIGSANDRVVLTRVAAPVFTTGTTATFFTRLFDSFQVSATGFPAPIYFVSAGTLPSGITLNFNTGLLSGSANPGSEGTYNFTITAANAIQPSADQNFTLTILTGVNPAFTSANSAIFTTGTGGTFTVTATGAPTPVLAVTTALPTGVTFTPASPANGTGVLAVGTNTPDGSYNLTFTATNGLSQASQAFTLTVGTAPTIVSANNALFYTGRTNAFTVQTTGFPAPLLSVVSGTLPTGVTLTGALLSGTPASTGTFNFTIRASNALGMFDQAFTLNVEAGVAPAITSANTATFTTNVGGTFIVTATGTPPPTLNQTQTLPLGVTFDSPSGVLTVGTNTPSGTYNLAFTANNGVSPTAFQSFTLIVGVPPAFTSANNDSFTAGQLGSFQVTASGVPAPTFSLFSGALPTGVTLSSSGLLSGTPSATGTFPVVIRATNALGVVDQNFTLTVAQAPVITSANNATFAVNTAGTFQVTTAAGTFPAATYAVTDSVVVPPGATAGLPNGVTLNPMTGLLSGTPTVSGLFSFRIVADNSAGSFGQDFTLTVTRVPAITSANSATFFTGAVESFQVTATGFPAPTFSLASGSLPAGVTLNPTTGVLGGTPTQAGVFNLTIRATNSVGTNDQPFTLTVITGAAPVFTSPATADVTVGVGGTFVVTATGSPTPVLAATSALPTGVSFNPATGVLLVDDTTPPGAYGITFTADNGVAPAGVQNFVLSVNQAPAITSAAATTFTAGVPGSFQVTADGFPVPVLAVAGTLPAGVIFDAGTGRLVGTPAAGSGGVYTLSVTATNSQGTATQPFILTVNQIPAFTSANSATFRGGSGGTFTVAATGFPAPVLGQTAALPAGVAFDASTGVLTVADTTFPGAYPLTFTATSSAGQTTQAFTLTVSAPPTGPTARLAVGGPTNGSAALYDQGGTGGVYNVTPTASVAPFGNIGVNVRTAVADVNGDGIDDTILVTGPGIATQFAVVNGADNASLLVAPTNPFLGTFGFTGGGYVAAGDFDLDGRADIVITPDQSGGPRVVILSLLAGGLTQRASFLGIDDANFRGGARPAVGDINADGVPDLVVMAGFGGGPRVALYSGATVFSAFPQKLVNDFFAFEPNLRNGAYAAVGDLTGDGAGDLIFGAGPGGAPRVLALDGATVLAFGGDAAKSAPVANFFVNNNEATRGGVRVATKSVVGSDAIALVAGSGENDPSRVKVYPDAAGAVNGEPLSAQTLDPFAQVLAGGVFVG